MMSDDYLTVEQVAEKLHMSTGTVRNRISAGMPMPPSFRIGRRRLFPVSEMDDWLTNRDRYNEDD